MKLEVPLIRQQKNTQDCGIAMLAMIFKYYDIKKSYEEIKKDIKVYDKIGTFAPQLGSYLIKNSFDVEIIQLNPFLFSLADKNKTNSELLDHLKKIQPSFKKERNKIVTDYFIKFLQDGGNLNVKIPQVQDVIKEIKEKRPVGALLTTRFLQNARGFNFHYNLVTGASDPPALCSGGQSEIIVNDPAATERGGEFVYNADDFFYGVHASAFGDLDNGCLILVRRG